MAKRNKKNQIQVAKAQLDRIQYTFDSLEEPAMAKVIQADRDRMDVLLSRLKAAPAEVIDEVEVMHRRYPNVLCFENWLCVCYRALGRRHEALRIYERQLQQSPDYIFARTSLADLALENFDIDTAVDLIQPDTETLKSLYPNREKFHISEVRHWHLLVGKIALLRGNLNQTRQCRDLLRHLEPNSPAAAELERLLNGNTETWQAKARLMSQFKKLSAEQREEIEVGEEET